MFTAYFDTLLHLFVCFVTRAVPFVQICFHCTGLRRNFFGNFPSSLFLTIFFHPLSQVQFACFFTRHMCFVSFYSLSALADVLGALSEHRSHIPYRNTRLTHMLQDTIGNVSINNTIGHFTVVCSVAWPLNDSEAGGDLALIQTSLLFSCKCKPVSITTT